MNETRERIDRKLDMLQARMTHAGNRALRTAGLAATGLAVMAVLVAWIRRRRLHRHRPVRAGWA